MRGTALLKLGLIFLISLNHSRLISAHDSDFGLISKSKWNRNNSPVNDQSQIETVHGEKVQLIVAEGISCWEQNGKWEKLQLCPNSTIVTGHRLRYLTRTGLTGIELKCTPKYERNETETESEHILHMNSEPEGNLPRGTWGKWKNKFRSVFAEGFSFNRGELSLRRSVQNYNVIYHSGNPTKTGKQSTVDSGKIYTKCPPDHAICGLTAMTDKEGLGILTSIGLKCCHHCVPEEKWVMIHQFNNTGDSKEVQMFNTTVGLKRSLKLSPDQITHGVLHKSFSARFGKLGTNSKSSSTKFNWPDSFYTVWTAETRINGTYTCGGKRSCGFKQLVGYCGSVRVLVGKFCEVSVPVGSSLPDSCNSNMTSSETTETPIAPSKTTIIYIYTYIQNKTHKYTDYHNNTHNQTYINSGPPIPLPTLAPPTTTTLKTTTTPTTTTTTQKPTDPPIIWGTLVDPSDPIPYQLSIRFQIKPPFGQLHHICSAAILDEKTAITAAHCFDSSTDVRRYRVVAGENNLDFHHKEMEQILQVKKLLIHPNYTAFSHGNDIAILQVDKFQLNQYARAVFLSPVSAENLSGVRALLSGWSHGSDSSEASRYLRKSNMSILSPQDCLEQLTEKEKVPTRQGIICAQDLLTPTCSRDSGGPLVIQNYKVSNSTQRGNLLVGISSFGPEKCSRKNSLGAFTEISPFYDWIQGNLDLRSTRRKRKTLCKVKSIGNSSGFSYELDDQCRSTNSIHSFLGMVGSITMVSLGAAGETAQEIWQFFDIKNNSDLIIEHEKLRSNLREILSQSPRVKFAIVDKIYANSELTVKTQYENDVKQIGVEIENVDFGNSEEAARTINSWFKNKTEGKIDKTVDSTELNAQTSLLVLNAIYFKGSWKNPFNVSNTRKRPFFINGSCSVNVSMMYQQNAFRVADFEEANATAILLPFKGEKLSMAIFLPNEGQSLETLENWLKTKYPFFVVRYLQTTKIDVSLPKFKMGSSLELNEGLKSLGFKKMFDSATANFSNMFSGSRNVFVSKVIHETFVEVDEGGDEAAAVTSFETSSNSSRLQFTANRPFLFHIFHDIHEIPFFVGQVKNPLDFTDSSSSEDEILECN